jgi:hypothetical protein
VVPNTAHPTEPSSQELRSCLMTSTCGIDKHTCNCYGSCGNHINCRCIQSLQVERNERISSQRDAEEGRSLAKWQSKELLLIESFANMSSSMSFTLIFSSSSLPPKANAMK